MILLSLMLSIIPILVIIPDLRITKGGNIPKKSFLGRVTKTVDYIYPKFCSEFPPKKGKIY
jgi:hypothetical protein